MSKYSDLNSQNEVIERPEPEPDPHLIGPLSPDPQWYFGLDPERQKKKKLQIRNTDLNTTLMVFFYVLN
jgi:hypothetical protein